MRYIFGPFELDPAARSLTRQNQRVRLTAKPMSLLLLLVESQGEVVTRDAIRDRLWGHAFLEVDQGINQCVRQIRAALGDDARRPLFVETLPGRGYRMVCRVAAVPAPARATGTGRRVPRPALAAVGACLVVALVLSRPPTGPGPGDGTPPAVPQLARDAVARAEARMDRRRPELLRAVVTDLDRAVSSAPDWRTLRVRLAVANSLLYWYSGDAEAGRAARAHLLRAEELPGPAEQVWFAKGVLSLHDRDFDGALRALGRARASNPDLVDFEIELMAGRAFRRMGRWEDAQRAFARALQANPTSFETTYALATTARYLGRHERAEYFLDMAIELDREHWIPWAIKPVDVLRAHADPLRAAVVARESAAVIGAGLVYASSQALSRVLSDEIAREVPAFDGPEVYRGAFHLSMGEALRVAGLREAALLHYRRAGTLLARLAEPGAWPESHRGQPLSLLAAVEAGRGRRGRALALVEETLETLPFERDALTGSWVRLQLAQVLVVLDERSRAVEYIGTLLDEPSPLTPEMLRVDPVWAPLWSDGSLVRLLEGRGIPLPRRRTARSR